MIILNHKAKLLVYYKKLFVLLTIYTQKNNMLALINFNLSTGST